MKSKKLNLRNIDLRLILKICFITIFKYLFSSMLYVSSNNKFKENHN